MVPGRALRTATFLSLLAGAAGCRRDEPPPPASNEEARRRFAELLAKVEAKKREARAASSVGAPLTGGSAKADAPLADPDPPPLRSNSDGPFVADEPVDVGPAGPATASVAGVVMNTREGDLFIARLGTLPRGATAGKTPVVPVPSDAGGFALGRGPSLFRESAYWISHGSLVRRRISGPGAPGPLEILARDAFDGTRVGIPIAAPGTKPAAIPATVAYVVRPSKEDAPLRAKLWVENAPSEVLTAEGNSTHSVSLVHTEEGVLAVSVQARMAITPVHARRVRFEAGRPKLEEDVVVWVGGGIQPLTEMTLLPVDARDLWGYLPHERSMKDFGIARLDIGMRPDMNTETTWTLYPNGIDPAPLATGHLCGGPVVLYAQPETRTPDSRQELLLADARDMPGSAERIAKASAFYFASLAAVPGGALAAWVTNEGSTWAATVRCKRGRN